ncbi:MAG: heavy-metal-associated domain-containing protein [Anaerolineaceae bacterium]|nr:heavy-metal-associated domain-containing protein [Anaerolineaceae bacterium]
MTTVTYKIPNISCNHCVHTITTEVGDIPGVTSVEASAETNSAKITFGPPATEDQILNLLTEINYPAEK